MFKHTGADNQQSLESTVSSTNVVKNVIPLLDNKDNDSKIETENRQGE